MLGYHLQYFGSDLDFGLDLGFDFEYFLLPGMSVVQDLGIVDQVYDFRS